MNSITVTKLKRLRNDELEALIDSGNPTKITKKNKTLAFLIPAWLYKIANKNIIADGSKGMERGK